MGKDHRFLFLTFFLKIQLCLLQFAGKYVSRETEPLVFGFKTLKLWLILCSGNVRWAASLQVVPQSRIALFLTAYNVRCFPLFWPLEQNTLKNSFLISSFTEIGKILAFQDAILCDMFLQLLRNSNKFGFSSFLISI